MDKSQNHYIECKDRKEHTLFYFTQTLEVLSRVTDSGSVFACRERSTRVGGRNCKGT